MRQGEGRQKATGWRRKDEPNERQGTTKTQDKRQSKQNSAQD
jgi:hypothetical protein